MYKSTNAPQFEKKKKKSSETLIERKNYRIGIKGI